MITNTQQQYYGTMPIPHIVLWSSENSPHVEICPHLRRAAVMYDISPGVGKPIFGQIHAQRQRVAVLKGLCHLCGGQFGNDEPKILLSARQTIKSSKEICVDLPFLHRACAAAAIRHCPHLIEARADVAALEVRKWEVYANPLTPEQREECGVSGVLPPSIDVYHRCFIRVKSFRRRSLIWLDAGT